MERRRMNDRKVGSVGVIPFGETVRFRDPMVARDRHQALEERWGKGLWLGHARHTPEAIIATEAGIVKVYAAKRLPADQQWDDERVKGLKGSPNTWKHGRETPTEFQYVSR